MADIESLTCTQCDKDIPHEFIEGIKLSGMIICPDCRDCDLCNMIVTDAELEFCIKYNRPIRHSRCSIQADSAQLKIPVSQQELEFLNLCRLIVSPDIDLSVETNKRRAELAQARLWESFTLEQKYMHTQMMENVYGACYLALKKDPSEVKAGLLKRDRENIQKAHSEAKKARNRELPSERRKMGVQEKFVDGMNKSGITDMEQIKAIWKSQGKVWMD